MKILVFWGALAFIKCFFSEEIKVHVSVTYPKHTYGNMVQTSHLSTFLDLV